METTVQTLKELLARSVARYASRPAISFTDDTPITYAELGDRVDEVVDFLKNRGIHSGDRVAILSENKPNWCIAYLAIVSMGAVAVPILPDFHQNEIHHILRHSEAKAIFISERLFDSITEARIEQLGTIILIDDMHLVPPKTRIDRLKSMIKEGSLELEKIGRVAARRIKGMQEKEVQPDDLASIVYTSGTTGHSKGVMLSHWNLVFNVQATLKIQMVNHNDRFISILPLSHAYENTVGFLLPLMQGASIYYLQKPPVARVLLPAMEKIKPTMILMVPLVMEKIYKNRVLPKLQSSEFIKRIQRIDALRKQILKMAGRQLMKALGGRLHFIGFGGAALLPEVEKFMRDAMMPYAVGYGLTETSPLIAGCTPKITRFRSTGMVLPDLEGQIHDPDPETGEGEIWVRGGSVMRGYYKDDERTREVITSDGWFKTGDLGFMDEDGYLYIRGRSKNVIVGPSGENIYPEELESHLNAVDLVQESLVYEENGQIVARVYPDYEKLDLLFSAHKLLHNKVERTVSDILEEIKEDVNKQVSRYSRIHKMIEQTEPFLRTPTQKIKRYLYVEGVEK